MPISPAELLALLDTFDWATWSKRLGDDLEPVYRDVVMVSGQRVLDAFSFDDPFTSQTMTRYIGERIVQLDEFTKANVSALLRRVLDEQGGGLSTFELGKVVGREVRTHVKGYETWRANRIARTESAIAYNHGQVLGVYQAGGEFVDVTDGDQDEPCASANGATWTIEEALANPVAHPNCTRVFSPSSRRSKHVGRVVQRLVASLALAYERDDAAA